MVKGATPKAGKTPKVAKVAKTPPAAKSPPVIKKYGKVTSTEDARAKTYMYCQDHKVSQKKFAEDVIHCSPTTLTRFLSGNYHGVKCSGENSLAYHAIIEFFAKK